MLKVFLLAFALSFSAQNVNAEVWKTTRQWDSKVESDFAHWVRTKWSEDVFISPQSPYQGIETDCAQATYAMRIIFLYENGLPFKVRNHNGGTTFFTNDMTNWDQISDANLRFRAFLKFMFTNISTRTLGLDTYPVAVTREGINSGAIYVDPGNHSVQVVDLTPQGIPVIQFSTTPQKVRFLTRIIAFPDMIPGQAKTNQDDGFRRFKSPDEVNLSVAKIAGYSLEQFPLAAQAFGDHAEYVKLFTLKLQQVSSSANGRAQQMVENICQAAVDRVNAVRDAIIVNSRNSDSNIKCMDSGDYYNTSTPDRDKDLRQYFVELQKLTNDDDWQSSPKDFYHEYADFIVGRTNHSPQFTSPGQECDLSEKGIGAPPEQYGLEKLFALSLANKLVSDPNASLEARWGLASYAPVCKQY